MNGLALTTAESELFEKDTRSQSKCPEWHKLRRHRITASNFKHVTSRRGNFETLANSLCKNTTVRTKAMAFGLEKEETVCLLYASQHLVKLANVGFVINPTASHLGCSPDRRVYDEDADPKWGLLEIKCSTKQSLADVSYLSQGDDGFQLKRSHQHFEQCMGQMGITGARWVDFCVWCNDTFHCERIVFDATFFSEMKAKLDSFYFNHFLPSLLKNAN